MFNSLHTTTPPEIEPISSALVMTHLRIDESNMDDPYGQNDELAMLDVLIVQAREMVEHRIGRKLITQTVEASYDSFPLYFELPPMQSVTSVKYYDADGVLQTLSPSNYIADIRATPSEIHLAPNCTWPTTQARRNAVIVEFVAGYGDAATDVPRCIIQWMLFAINTAWNTRHQFDLSTGRAAMTEVPRAEYIDRALDSVTVRYSGI